MNTLKLGCDPELFLADAAGVLRSSIGLIGGSKEAPMPLPLGPGYAVQEDNVAVEFNTPPADNAEIWSTQIKNTITFLEDHISEKYGLKFSKLSAGFFQEEELVAPGAKVFGCEPDFNAWTDSVNPRPFSPQHTLRSCGGHVHVGWQFTDKNQARRAIKLLDLMLGVPSVLLDDGELRKELYGKAGACRYKPYGVEYRTLSNFWVLDERLHKWVWNNTSNAVKMIHTDFDIDSMQEDILEAINNNNKEKASELVAKHNIWMP